MTRFHLILGLTLALGAAVAAPVGLPSFDPIGGEVGGKYLTDSGYLRFTVDDIGRVQGYYENGSQFGEISGHFDGRTIRGYWLEDGDLAPCEADRAGFASWGRLTLNFENASRFEGSLGSCSDAPNPDEAWSGRRADRR